VDWIRAVTVDHDDRDFRPDAPPGSRYVLADAPLGRPAWFRTAERRLVEHLRTTEELELLRNRALDVVQRPGEDEAGFRARVEAAADARSDEEALALREDLTTRAAALREAIAEAQARVEDLEAEQRRKQAGGALKAAGSLLGALLGGRRSSRSLARSITTAAGGVVGRPGSAARSRARRKLDQAAEDLAGVEADLAERLVELDRRWTERAAEIDTLRVRLSAADITVQRLGLCWIPTGG
jgi:hypothetical protein